MKSFFPSLSLWLATGISGLSACFPSPDIDNILPQILNTPTKQTSTASSATLDIRIPVVDMNDFYDPQKQDQFLETLYQAMTKIGFFAVRNTGVNRNTIKNAYREAAIFFKADPAQKAACTLQSVKGQRGFVPGESAKGSQEKDFKEFYHIGPELSPEELARYNTVENIWPKEQPAFKESMVAIYNELDQYTHPLLQAVVAVINKNSPVKLPENHLCDTAVGGNMLLRALYYPAIIKSNKKQSRFWAAEHTDIDLLTILPYSTAKGLQVKVDEQWLNVVVPEDTFIVNIGDMLENLTNGLFVSARHRVLSQEAGKERFSMVYFVHPSDSTSLAPLDTCIMQTGGIQKYAAGTRLEFLWERLLELNIAPGLLETYAATGHTERQMQYGRQSPQVVEMLIAHGLASPEVLSKIKN